MVHLIHEAPATRKPGFLKGALGTAFFEPLPEDELGGWERWRFSSIRTPSSLWAFDAPDRDPFDRMIAAQALIENLPVIGKDEALRQFGVTLLW